MAHNGSENTRKNGYHLRRRVVGPVHSSSETVGAHSGSGAEGARTAKAGDAALEWGALWHTIRSGKWIILLTVVLVTAGVTTYTLMMDPVYESESIVSIETQQSQQAALPFGTETSFLNTNTLSSEVGFLKNSAVLSGRVVERLQKAADALETNEHFPLLEKKNMTSRDRARQLMSQTHFEPSANEGMIRIRAESISPEEAASIANFYGEEYKRISREQSRERVAAAKDFLEKQVKKRGQELRNLEGQLEHFAREKQVPTQGKAGEELVAEYRGFRRQRDEAQFNLEQEQVTLQYLQQQLDQVKPKLEKQVLQEGAASELQESIDALNKKIADLKTQAEAFYAVNPELRGQETDIDELEAVKDQIAHFSRRKRKLTNQLVNKELQASSSNGGSSGGAGGESLGYVAQLRSRIAETKLNIREQKARVERLEKRLSSYDGRLASLPRQSIERGQLERQIKRAERWYNSFVERLQKIKVAEQSELGNVRIVRSAFVPGAPVRPNVKQNVILGILLGLGFGIGLAFVRGASDQRLTGPEDVEERGYELVGVIPEMGKEIKQSFNGQDAVEVEGRQMSTSLMTVLSPMSPVAENFRLLRTNIQHVPTNGSPLHVLLVTSPGPADGKSVTSMNLAVSMAQAGRRTLLIDADIRRPSAHHLMGVSLHPGLADLLTGRACLNLEDLETTVEDLSVLPAGRLEGRVPTELFESDLMRNLMAKLRQYYDVILLDSPPVLAVTDAVVLSEHSDAAVIVASANQTDARALQVTQDRLHAVGAHVAGTVVNRVDAHGASFQGYGYEYYGSYAEAAEA